MRARVVVMLAAMLMASCVFAAFQPNPKGAVKALKVTKGKPFRTGIVFIEGKYVPPPYTVERYGLVLRVNKNQVTGPVIPWEEFVKTQEGVVVSKNTVGGDPAPEGDAAEPEPEPEPELEEDEYDGDDLSDLFDDEPTTKKPSATKKTYKPKPRKPVVTTTYTLSGDFVPNDTTKALVGKINQARTDIDALLRQGGFVFFGSDYTRVTGDAGTAKMLLMKLPDIMKTCKSAKELRAAVRANGFTFIPDALCRDLYLNRVDYIKLLERQKAIKEESDMNSLMRGGL